MWVSTELADAFGLSCQMGGAWCDINKRNTLGKMLCGMQCSARVQSVGVTEGRSLAQMEALATRQGEHATASDDERRGSGTCTKDPRIGSADTDDCWWQFRYKCHSP